MLAGAASQSMAGSRLAHGDGVGSLHRRGCRQQLAPYPNYRLARQRTVMAAQQAPQDAGLAARTHCHPPLAALRGHLRHHLRPRHQKIMDGIVQAIDLRTQTGQGDSRVVHGVGLV